MKRKEKAIKLDPCWKCEGEVFIQFKHLTSGYTIHACKNCFAPAKLNDPKGLKLMEKVGTTNKAAAEYARTWRNYLDTKRET